ncbi:putative calmodulin [Neospora caninum Liverpool]|uniref:Calmodulin n=1 Tax=Neospora caninum (strain Liverpool) TaxID=572307 RepID=F0VJ44_NEOCL|nr:putative calmodulin [Neospora caninum Liverpool]CBZ53755.1 putative calmodulin [Neospora caninum Liverpool]CEL67747.1 TPA: calmodulin, putative [Neospora caninum Liverpool]|eukprot:XP_003883787.1 putative calmodulin [Neospora caninum Liverpool]
MYPQEVLPVSRKNRAPKGNVETFLARVAKTRKHRRSHADEDIFAYEEEKRRQNAGCAVSLDESESDDDSPPSSRAPGADEKDEVPSSGTGKPVEDGLVRKEKPGVEHVESPPGKRPEEPGAQRGRDNPREKLSDELLRDCVECFMLHDGDKDGFVPIDELPWMLRNLGQFWTKKELNGLTVRLQIEGVSQLNVTDFIDIVAREQDRRQLDVGKLLEAFRVMDRQKKNSVVLSELKHYMQVFGERMSEDDWNTLVGMKVDVWEGYQPSAIKRATFIEMFSGKTEDSL